MKTYITLLMLITSVCTFAQKMPSDYFDEANTFYEEKKYDEALAAYQYIIDHHPKNDLYPRAFYNIGCIYIVKKDFEKSIDIFKRIVLSDFNEQEELGNGIMADPYTNYKHRSCNFLSHIYFEKEMYDSSLYYFSLADTVFPYLHFCGNEQAANKVFTALRYSEIYQQLKQPDEAIRKLLPAIFTSLADNSEVLIELNKLLSGRKDLIEKLNMALKEMYSKKIEIRGYIYDVHYFKFLNAEIEVPGYFKEKGVDFRIEDAIKNIKQTKFYKLIENLSTDS